MFDEEPQFQPPPACPPSCPPRGAVPIYGSFYRIISNPPTPQDLGSYLELGIPFTGHDYCRACGISIFKDRQDAVDLLAGPGKHQGKVVILGHFFPTDGKVMKTGRKSHHTWWPDAQADRRRPFVRGGAGGFP